MLGEMQVKRKLLACLEIIPPPQQQVGGIMENYYKFQNVPVRIGTL
jgi:hypothetical protein